MRKVGSGPATGYVKNLSHKLFICIISYTDEVDIFTMTEIIKQKIVSGCKKSFLNFLHSSHALRCVGHLVELAQPEAYDTKYSKWVYADLPIFPMNWQYEVSAGTKKQFGILKTCMHFQKPEAPD